MSAEPGQMPWWPADEGTHPRGANRYEQQRIDAARRRVDRFLRASRAEARELRRAARVSPQARAIQEACGLAGAQHLRLSGPVKAFAARLEDEIAHRTAVLDPSGSREWLARTAYDALDHPPREVDEADEDIRSTELAINEVVVAAALAELARHRLTRTRYHLLLMPWRSVFAPAEIPPRRAPRPLPAEPIGRPADPESLTDWRAFCEWLEAMPYNASYSPPRRFATLVSPASRRQRVDLALIFWSAGYGWRLRKHYAARLAELASDER